MRNLSNSSRQIWGILDVVSQEINDLLSDESAVHVEDDQARVTPPNDITLKNHIHVPLLLEPIDHLMLPQVVEPKVLGSRCRRERQLNNARLLLVVETPVRRIRLFSVSRKGEGRHEMEE
jgi:hypothetical protein